MLVGGRLQMYFCNGWNLYNINKRNGLSPYQARYPLLALPTMYPFGCRCTFVPPKLTHKVKGVVDEGPSKPQPKGVEAILLGYTTSPGGLFDCKECVVVPVDNFIDNKT